MPLSFRRRLGGYHLSLPCSYPLLFINLFRRLPPPTQNRLQDHSFNNETTTAYCSLPMLTCPSDEVGPSRRWCPAELAAAVV